MTIQELKEAQKLNIPICWEWSGLDLEGRIDGFVEPDQVVIKWKSMQNNAMRFTEYISVIPCGLFKEAKTNEINIKQNE